MTIKLLNVGCRTKTSAEPGVVNIDRTFYYQIKSNPILSALSPFFLTKDRLKALKALPSNILHHNLKKGIPFPDQSVEAVYHCYFFGHLDQEDALNFLVEARRVLKPGGIHRVVVPDFHMECRAYLDHYHRCENQPEALSDHDGYISHMIELMVRKESYGVKQFSPYRRYLENLLLGDTRKRGESLQWVYDRYSLTYFLEQAGYTDIRVESHQTSRIPDWNTYGLDVDESGKQYRLGALYLEACKP